MLGAEPWKEPVPELLSHLLNPPPDYDFASRILFFKSTMLTLGQPWLPCREEPKRGNESGTDLSSHEVAWARVLYNSTAHMFTYV